MWSLWEHVTAQQVSMTCGKHIYELGVECSSENIVCSGQEQGIFDLE